MSTREKSQGDVGRRDFLKLFGAAGAAASTLPLGGSASADEMVAATADTKHHRGTAATEPQAGGSGYEFFNVDESAFIEAAIDTLIPSDSTGPGAKELGVAIYIDRQMAGGYGKGDRLYRYARAGLSIADDAIGTDPNRHRRRQCLRAENPQEHFREPIGKRSRHGDDRPRWQEGRASNSANRNFFGLLLQLTIEGYFADPMYGGNKDGAAWKMIGFPGADAMYMDKIEPFRNKPYAADPKGIQDLI